MESCRGESFRSESGGQCNLILLFLIVDGEAISESVPLSSRLSLHQGTYESIST